jgi:hypothetical protein
MSLLRRSSHLADLYCFGMTEEHAFTISRTCLLSHIAPLPLGIFYLLLEVRVKLESYVEMAL